jgi:hypothetical protein
MNVADYVRMNIEEVKGRLPNSDLEVLAGCGEWLTVLDHNTYTLYNFSLDKANRLVIKEESE